MAKEDCISIVKPIVLQVLNELNYQLFDLEFVNEDGNDILRVSIDDKDYPITFEILEKINKVLEPKIDELDPIKTHYLLEISSPGVERPIRNLEDYKQAIDKYVSIYVNDKIDQKEVITGYLKVVNENSITVLYRNKTKDKEANIEFANIKKAHLAVKF